MEFQRNINLLPYNTFKIQASASLFVEINNVAEAQALFRSDEFKNNPHLILGGGSNILLTKDFQGLVIKNNIKGIEIVGENENQVLVRAGAGVGWHDLVMFCVDRNFGGIENLSLIPGTSGAAPMQNIGAYGVEIKDVIVSVEAIEMKSGLVRTFSNGECAFGYRESIFKQDLKNQYFISSITLSLTTKQHRINTSYGAITDVLKRDNITEPGIREVSNAVIEIRRSKLPDPAIIGNAGSFFKNPAIEREQYDSLKEKYPSIPFFPYENARVKVPAGWLIEQCGWKGKTFENIGVHKHQALVLVNYGGGKGDAIWQLAMKIQESVLQTFGIKLQPEVNVIA